MSFTCKACGQQRAGANDPVVCSDCRNTQLGRAVLVLATFRGLYEEQVDALEAILTEAQNDTSDGSINLKRWNKLQALVEAAQAYNDTFARAIEP